MDERQDDITRRLDELEAQIREKRKCLEKPGVIGEQLEREWDQMLRQYADLRRRLRTGQAKGSQAGVTLHQDIDVLRHSFFRWAARVDERFKGTRGA